MVGLRHITRHFSDSGFEFLPVSPAGAIACSATVGDLRADLVNAPRPPLANNLEDCSLGISGLGAIGVFRKLAKAGEAPARQTLASIILAV